MRIRHPGFLFGLFSLISFVSVLLHVESADAAPPSVHPQIMVDQFGYRPRDIKVAVISDPIRGFNAARRFVPGARYQIRRWNDDSVAFEGRLTQWKGGRLHGQSGDRGWWFTFSRLSEPGSYYVYDVARQVGSGRFEVNENVYVPILDAALRMFYFNRANIAHTDAAAGQWTDAAAYVGPGQDTEARYVRDRNNPDSARDMSGGWFDAGDTNKYVTFASEVVHQLLTAWSEYPEAFDDEHGIPESGNGIPDVLDEVLVELDWLEKMQDTDGGVFIKMGKLDYELEGLPSEDRSRRFYEQKCSSSTIAASAMFAHAAVVFRDAGLFPDRVADYQRRAVNARRWYNRNPKRDDCDPQIVKAGKADWSVDAQRQQHVVAMIYLYALTGASGLNRSIARDLAQLRPFRSNDFTTYNTAQGDGLMFYRTLPNASATIVERIDSMLRQHANTSPFFSFRTNADLYAAYMPNPQYHWGSSTPKSNIGSMNFSFAAANINPARDRLFMRRGMAHLHYMHGVNPLRLVYLSNMYSFGAERSANQIFHFWFNDGTDYDNARTSLYGPAPGYVVGGPNRTYSGSFTPPLGQPPQKAYRDFNGLDDRARSYEITEPGIYYQSAYIRLISAAIGDYRRRYSN